MKKLLLLLLLIPNLVMAETWECNYTEVSGHLLPPESSIVTYSRTESGFYDDFDGMTHSIVSEDERGILLSVHGESAWIMTNFIDKETRAIKETMISRFSTLSKSGKCKLIK